MLIAMSFAKIVGRSLKTIVLAWKLITLDAGLVAFPVVNHGPEHGPGPLRDYRKSFAIGWRSLKVMKHVRDYGNRGAEKIILVW